MTAEEWAPYGLGEPDADGWYPDYRPLPAALRPAPPTTPVKAPAAVDVSIVDLLTHWRLVVADLITVSHIDLYDPAVLARPWPGVRTAIFSLLDQPTRLREVLLTRR